MTPLWLLDVDGVLNAVNLLQDLKALEENTSWPDYCEGRAESGRSPGHTYNIIWSPTLIKRITALHESGTVDIRWLTTWETRAQTEIAPLLGLPHFELAGQRDLAAEHRQLTTGGDTPGDYWWKLPLARAAVVDTPDRRLIWTDDDLTSVPEAVQWARQRWENGGGQACLVMPRWELGISPNQMDVIEAFAKGELR